jgi:hypothetical protein
VSITSYALKMIEEEWYSLKLALQTDQDLDLGVCRYELLL